MKKPEKFYLAGDGDRAHCGQKISEKNNSDLRICSLIT